VLTIRRTKFGKSRLAALHPTTCRALAAYVDRRTAHLGSRCGPTFLVAEQGGRLVHQYVHRVFWRLSREIGLRRPWHATGPRVYDSGIIPSAGLFRVDTERAQDSDDLRPFDRHNQRLFRKARR
jgi:hypothetical protein